MLFLDQMRAIFAPIPYLPRACRTPYLLLDSTTPSMSGICDGPPPANAAHKQRDATKLSHVAQRVCGHHQALAFLSFIARGVGGQKAATF